MVKMKATEVQKQQMKDWYKRNKKRKMEGNKAWLKKKKQDPNFVAKTKAYYNAYYQKNKEKCKNTFKERNKRVTKEVFTHYGGNPPKCSCGFSDMRALTIDHIHGGGRKERQKLRKIGATFYRWLQVQGYPEGYQILCMNCQFIKMKTGDITT